VCCVVAGITVSTCERQHAYVLFVYYNHQHGHATWQRIMLHSVIMLLIERLEQMEEDDRFSSEFRTECRM